ncbi:MAG: PadR family transcriptional regulator [Gemmatimonadota bacterium]
MLILKALSMEPRHGYAVSEWIEAVTEGTLLVEEGTLYPALHRLEARGWIEAEWGLSENNRRAKFYRLTAAGRERLAGETSTWRRYTKAVAKALESGLQTPEPDARAGEPGAG